MINILVTGGASGLGAAITKKLAADPANQIHFTFHRSFADAQRIEAEFTNTHGVHCDFKDPINLNRLVEAMGGWELCALVNCAITGLTQKHFHKMEMATFLDGFRDNVMPVIRITQGALLHFRKRKFGRIITVLSAYLLQRPPTGMSEYLACKAYLETMSRSWASENVAFNITANCVSPSFMKTGLTSNVDERVVDEMTDAHPLRRLLTPAEVADAIEMLLRSTPHINGTNLVINGG